MLLHRWMLLAPALVAVAQERAEACQPGGCPPAIRVGRAPPANLGGLVFAPGFRDPWDPARAPDLVLVDAASGSTLTTTLESLSGGRYLARIASDLIPGREYVAHFDQACRWSGSDRPMRSFRAGDTAPLPTSLGTLRVEWTRVDLWDTDLIENAGADPDRCRQRESRVAVAGIRLDAPPELAPWVDALEIETVIDGVVQPDPRPGEIWSAPSKEFGVNRFGFHGAPVWLPCGSDGRASGTREVRMRAWSEALGIRLETPSLTVALSCAEDSSDAGTPEDTDNGEPDVYLGPPALDEATASCGCATHRPARDTPLVPLLALASLAVARVRLNARRR